MILHPYGSVEPIYFKVTLSGAAVAGITFQAADVKISKDGGAFANVGTACAEVGLGWYKWTPALAANTQAKKIVINIKDDVGTAFDENGIQVFTGGNSSALFNGA